MQGKLDEKDLQIIFYLKEHGRDKISEISSKLQIPRATVFERMERLKKDGYIQKYTVDLDFEKLGYPIMAYILIEYDFKAVISQRELCRNLFKLDNVLSSSLIAGNWDLMILVVAKNMKELSDLVLGKLKGMEGITRTLSVPVFDHIH